MGNLLVQGASQDFVTGRVMKYVYFSATLDAAVWGVELAGCQGRGRIYIFEPTGEVEDDGAAQIED